MWLVGVLVLRLHHRTPGDGVPFFSVPPASSIWPAILQGLGKCTLGESMNGFPAYRSKVWLCSNTTGPNTWGPPTSLQPPSSESRAYPKQIDHTDWAEVAGQSPGCLGGFPAVGFILSKTKDSPWAPGHIPLDLPWGLSVGAAVPLSVYLLCVSASLPPLSVSLWVGGLRLKLGSSQAGLSDPDLQRSPPHPRGVLG